MLAPISDPAIPTCRRRGNINSSRKIWAPDLPNNSDILWASPPCMHFSVAAIGHNWEKAGDVYTRSLRSLVVRCLTARHRSVRQDFAGSEGKKANRQSNGNGEVKIATPIPDDLEPNDRDLLLGKSGGYEGCDFNRLWLSFKSHHQSKGDVSKDWHAEFARYLCTALDMAAERQRARGDA